jgi:Ribonuclease G/E
MKFTLKGVSRKKTAIPKSAIPSNDAFHAEYMRRKNQPQKKGLIARTIDKGYVQSEVATDLKDLSDKGTKIKQYFKNFILGVGAAFTSEAIENLIKAVIGDGRGKKGD